MWGWLYLATLAFAAGMTVLYLTERAVVFAAGSAAVAWLTLAYQSELEIVSNGGTVAVKLAAIRWLWAAVGLLSLIALVGAILGYYPESETPTEEAYTP